MTRDIEDFETQVRLALGEHAGGAPRVDLADGALSRARGIRRRRVALSAAATLVTVAVAVPVGAQMMSDDGTHNRIASDPTTDSGPIVIPTTVQIEIAGLKTGDAPNVPYVEGDTFVDASGAQHTVKPAKGAFVSDAAAIDGGELVFEQNLSAVITYTANGGSSDLPQAKSVTPPAIDQRTQAAVFALHDADSNGAPRKGDTLVYAKGLTGDSTTVETDLHVRQVMGAYQGRVVFNGTGANKEEVVGVVMMAGSDGTVTKPYSRLKTVTAVSPDESMLAGILSHGWLRGQRHCPVMLDADTQDTLWTRCSWNPVEFSPDGSRVLAVEAGSEGFGPNHLAVLDAQTGAVVAEYTTSGAFGRATFDGSADSIVTVVVDGRQAALVRCPTDGGECELASPTASVTPGEPNSLTEPYQLTAN
jgi:hypothetical protein